jgi:type I restriction enzyme, S subunit
MNGATQTFPKAFAVWFKDLRVWSVGAFVQADWQWSPEVIKPLNTALHRKVVEIDKAAQPRGAIKLATLRFDGTIEPREQSGLKEVKGKLYLAQPGDVIYSKIDVRNGAIGIVPEAMGEIAVSSEFPVYEVLPEVADPQFVKLLFRTNRFRQIINSMISGASGRKRVQPSQLEVTKVPLPPLLVQRAIVARWQQAQDEAKKVEERIAAIEANIKTQFLLDLGFTLSKPNSQPKAFAVLWKDLFQWSGRATYLLQQTNLAGGKYPLAFGYDCLSEVRHGCSASPASFPTTLHVLKISSVTRGELVPSARKFMHDRKIYRDEFNLKAGDVLLCRTNGTLAYVGMSALVTEEMDDLIFPDKLIRVRARENILPAYLWQVLQTAPLRSQIEAAARTAVGNYAIGTSDIWNLRIPLPPPELQREIVRRVEEGCAEITREQSDATSRLREAEAEVEALILGTKRIENIS